MSNYFQSQLTKSLQHGFIHRHDYPDGNYAPQILINKPAKGAHVLTTIQDELLKCDRFYFSVAFISKAGIAMLKTQLSDLADRGVEGYILISPYLGFNDPDAMRELLKLSNVQVRLTREELNMHAKCYLFQQGERHVVILGSSNLTYTALKKNYEWNIKLTSAESGDFIQKMYQEYDQLWQESLPLDEIIINQYDLARQKELTVLGETPGRDNLPERDWQRPLFQQTPRAQESIAPLTKEPLATYETQVIRPNKMQVKALASLQQVRDQGARRALVVSATGTGKTYLSAFDVEQYKPRRMLFVVHREQILRKAQSDFQRVIGFQMDKSCIYRPGMNLADKQYVFVTIQTLSRDANLAALAPDLFDYLLIDEVHKAGAATYQKVIDHFKPDFLLGMTATPERTDGFNIYELFDYNVAYEIRLQEALDEDMLCPFMYYGVKDIELDGQLLDETSDFSQLVADNRVNHLIEKVTYYGVSGQTVKGLIFCSRKDEAHELSHKLNERGYRTQALTGEDSQEVRQDVVVRLEAGDLDYILTVDIFNEGIDIPSVNQVIMLRNTESSIIFIQQLGRGLRKHDSKEFVTIIDFIGNYKNNYLIPIALYGDRSMNKDEYRRKLVNRQQLSGMTTINFEAVAREQIFSSIKQTKLSSMKNLKEAYIEMRNRKGRVPHLMDFLLEDSLDPIIFFEGSFKHYGQVIDKFEEEVDFPSSKELDQFLQFICEELLPGKRPHEIWLMKRLVEGQGDLDKEAFYDFLAQMKLDVSPAIRRSIEGFLDLSFFAQTAAGKFGEPIIVPGLPVFRLNATIQSFLANTAIKDLLLDMLETALKRSERYADDSQDSPFKLGERYSRKDVCHLLNWKINVVPQNIGGYFIDAETNTMPIYVTYHKSDEISDTTKYEDAFINEKMLHYFSKSKRRLESNDVQQMMNADETGLAMHLFIKKDNSEGTDFYYLGRVHYQEGSALQEVMKTGDKPVSVVSMNLELEHEVPYSLYHYLNNN